MLANQCLITCVNKAKIALNICYIYNGGKPEEWGISGFVVIAESHISFHTFVERSFINLHVFSCRDFDTEKAIEYFQDKIQLTKYKSYIVNRDWSKSYIID